MPKSQEHGIFPGLQKKVGNSGDSLRIKLEGDPKTLTFGLMLLCDLTWPQVPAGLSKFQENGLLPGLPYKCWEFRVLHKTKPDGDAKIYPFGFMQLFDLT